MSLFGKLDAANVKTNPLYIEAGEYPAEVTKAEFRVNRSGERQLFLQYTIVDEDSKYHNKRASQFYTLPPADLDAEGLEILREADAKAAEKIESTISGMKRTLSGTSGFAAHRGLGVPEEDLNDPEWTPEGLVGTKIILTISNYGLDGVNIRMVNKIVDE